MSDPIHRDELSTLSHRTAPGLVILPTFQLEVGSGPDVGASWNLDGTHTSRVLLGTGAACEVRLSDRHVSRRHAALEPHERELRITDLDSANGCFVNGVRIGQAFLRGGESIRVGKTLLRVVAVSEGRSVSISRATSFGKVVSVSVEMRRMYPFLERLAHSDVPALIEGETGTGKELLAESIHESGARKNGPFIVVDCGALPRGSLDAEFFGTGSDSQQGPRRGAFELAQGGTLLIDELGALDAPLQQKLLRTMQRGEMRRPGGEEKVQLNVRVLATTRRNLDKDVQLGRFRDELLSYIAVARIELPPLRDRRGDVAVLAHLFWERLGGRGSLPYEFLLRAEDYPWPGNVKELEIEIAKLITTGESAGFPSRPSSVPPASGAQPPSSGPSLPDPPSGASDPFMAQVLELDLPMPRARERIVEEFQRRYVERVLGQHGGNVTRAAAASGLAYRYFQLLRSRQRR